MSIPAPFDRFRGEVLPEWIDYNGHMNLAYYTVLFDQATDLLFDGLRRQVNAAAAPPGTTVQWLFQDAEPWYMQLDNGDTVVSRGRVENPDLVFRCRFGDWVDLAAGRLDPRRALLTGRIRPSGKLRMLARAPKLFM